jgi:hypothetical protein
MVTTETAGNAAPFIAKFAIDSVKMTPPSMSWVQLNA